MTEHEADAERQLSATPARKSDALADNGPAARGRRTFPVLAAFLSALVCAFATAPIEGADAQESEASAPRGENSAPAPTAEQTHGDGSASDANTSPQVTPRTPADNRRAARKTKQRAQRRARKRARARQREATRKRMQSYRVMRKRWHKKAPIGMVRSWQAQTPPPLVLRPVGSEDEFTFVPDDDGRFLDRTAKRDARRAFQHRTGQSKDIHPRVLELVYRAVKAFDAPWVVLVSGYRPDRGTSRHTMGRAADVVLPGVSDQKLARFFRQQGFAGVGQYTVSGFVHLDVRDRSYFWVDRSMPGRPSRRRPILTEAALKADQQARARGEEQVAAPGTRGRDSNGGRARGADRPEETEADETAVPLPLDEDMDTEAEREAPTIPVEDEAP